MFPSLLPHTTRSTLKTAPKLVNFCACKSYFKNVVYSGATSLCGQILNYKNSEDTRRARLPFTENSRSTYVSFENTSHGNVMFPSLLPHNTRSTVETAPKLVYFCVCKPYFKNVVNTGATSLCGQILN